MLLQHYKGRERKRLTKYQELMLTKSFQGNPFPKDEEMHQQAVLLNLTKERIKRWFVRKRHYIRPAGFRGKGG